VWRPFALSLRRRSSRPDAGDDKGALMRLLLVDDHEAVCLALARFIEQEASRFIAEDDGDPCVTVTPVSSLARAVVELKREPPPTLVLLDLGLGGESQGSATLERFQQANSAHVPVAVFTGLAHNDKGAGEIFRTCMHKLGARGIITKTAKIDKMFVGLNRILHDEPWVSEEVLMAMLDPTVKSSTGAAASTHGLTKREQDIARLLARGLRTKEMAKQLGLAPGHVTQVISKILEKLDVQNRTQAAIKISEFHGETKRGL